MADAATKEHAHELIDRIDPAQVVQAVAFLEKLLDPLEFALANAPFEDEEIGAEEKRASAEAQIGGYRGTTTHEEMLMEFGITQEDVDNFLPEQLLRQDSAAMTGRVMFHKQPNSMHILSVPHRSVAYR
jgi:hypothetical protein